MRDYNFFYRITDTHHESDEDARRVKPESPGRPVGEIYIGAYHSDENRLHKVPDKEHGFSQGRHLESKKQG